MVTVSFSYKTTSGSPAKGTVAFRPLGAGAIDTRVVQLVNGQGSIDLEVADPSSVFVVSQAIDKVSPSTVEVTVPSSPSTVNLATLLL